MPISDIAKRAAKLLADNSPTVLTVIGVTGALTTAYLTGRATFKAAEVLSYGEVGVRLQAREDFPLKEKVQLCWKFYIPAVASATLTVAAIIAANRIGSRRVAAITTAFVLSEKAFEEYRDKVVEKIGKNKELAVRDELAQDRVNRNSPDESKIIIANPEASVLCLESYTGRYFINDMETLRKAMNDINHRVNNDYYASLDDLYDLIGLEHTDVSSEVGWNADRLLEMEFSSTLTATGKPCLVVSYRVQPIRGYHRLQ